VSSFGSPLQLVEAEVAQIWEVSEAVSQGVVPRSAENKSLLILTCVFRLMRKRQSVDEGGPPMSILNPQNAMSCSTSAYLGSTAILVS
jgi:hypothetical protein